jgi:hypothetical protein
LEEGEFGVFLLLHYIKECLFQWFVGDFPSPELYEAFGDCAKNQADVLENTSEFVDSNHLQGPHSC